MGKKEKKDITAKVILRLKKHVHITVNRYKEIKSTYTMIYNQLRRTTFLLCRIINIYKKCWFKDKQFIEKIENMSDSKTKYFVYSRVNFYKLHKKVKMVKSTLLREKIDLKKKLCMKTISLEYKKTNKILTTSRKKQTLHHILENCSHPLIHHFKFIVKRLFPQNDPFKKQSLILCAFDMQNDLTGQWYSLKKGNKFVKIAWFKNMTRDSSNYNSKHTTLIFLYKEKIYGKISKLSAHLIILECQKFRRYGMLWSNVNFQFNLIVWDNGELWRHQLTKNTPSYTKLLPFISHEIKRSLKKILKDRDENHNLLMQITIDCCEGHSLSVFLKCLL